MPTILFVGGGSVGHIAPSLAVWNECKAVRGDLDAHFVCGPKKDDTAFLAEHNVDFMVLNAPRLSLTFPFRFLKAVRKAHAILAQVQPNVVFSKGGYVSLPLSYAAHKRGIPIVLHESDSVSGYANRIVSMWAQTICTGFPSKHTHTGNPVRKEMLEGSKKEGLRITGLSGEKPVLLVMGGSQGAQALNHAIASMQKDLLLRCDIIHITGRGKTAINLPNTNHYYQTDFANEELAHLYACSDFALSRAGAGSIAELAANGIPTILVPLRGVGHDHQYSNAIIAAKHGGCIHLEQSALEKELLPTVHKLATETDYRAKLSEAMGTLNSSDAALQIAKIMLQALDKIAQDQ